MITEIQTQELALTVAESTQYVFVQDTELIYVGGGQAIALV